MNNLKKNKLIDSAFKTLGMLFTLLGIIVLAILLYNIIKKAKSYSFVGWEGTLYCKLLMSKKVTKQFI